MRTHTAMHALCGIIWDRFQSPVTGGNMEPGEGRLDFELPDWDGVSSPSRAALNMALQKALPVEVSFLPREEADQDPSLIRTKVSLLPSDLTEVRVIDIVGLARRHRRRSHPCRLDHRGGRVSSPRSGVEGKWPPAKGRRARVE